MLAYARITLKIPQDEFWSLTPAQFEAFSSEERDRSRYEDYRFGIIEATLRAVHGDKKARAFDSFPQHKNKTSKRDAAKARASFAENAISLAAELKKRGS